MAKIIHKKSSISAKVPLVTDLEYGELALNYTDGLLYFKNSSNVVSSFKSDTSSFVTLNGTQTLTNKTLTSPVVSGGTIDSAVIGGTTPTLGTFTNVTATNKLISSASAGDEGGEIELAAAQTNTTLSGNVTIDIWRNRLRIFEAGGTNRGVYIDLSAAGVGVGSNLLSGGAAGVTSVGGYTGDVTAAQLLASISTIDGAGSGLDADLLDGQSSAYYLDWTNTTNKPTTLAGYGITDAATSTHNHNGTYQPVDADLTAIAALAGTSGFLKKTAADTWSLDTSTYLTGNQSISVSGDATGSGTTSIALTLANSGVVAGTYTKVTVDAKGRVTTGASLASADLPTYTGTITSSQVTTALGYTPYNSTNPSGYTTNTGTVTSVGGTGTVSGLTLTGTVTTTGNLTLGGTLSVTPSNFASQTANTVLAAPNGSAGTPTFRAIVAADIPTLNQNTTGNAGTVTNGVYTTGTYADPAWIASINYSKLTGTAPTWNQNTTGTSAAWTTARTLSFTGDATGSGSVDGSTNVATALTLAASGVTAGTYTKITVDAKGRATSGTTLAATDIPVLDASKITTGVFDAARLPSYVDDVLEYTNLAAFPASGETGKIYVDLTTNKTYRWSGTVYVYITSGAVDSVAGKTGVVTLVKGDVGLGNVENTALSTWSGSTNITTLGTVSSGTWNATNVALSKGGTNASLTATLGGVVYSTATKLAITSAGTAGQVLTSNGAAAPTWQDAAGGSAWIKKITTYTATKGDKIIADTTTTAFTITLPATPSTGDSVTIADANNWSINNLTIDRNGSTIEGLSDNFILDIKGIVVDFVYDGTTWEIFSLGGSSASAKGAGGDQVFFENGMSVTTSYAITTGMNAMSAGPITILNDAAITIPTGSTWTVV